MSRYIDADAYAAEMKTRQDALKELMDDADALDNWEMYDGLSRAFSVFVEAKLTLDAMPTVDAVPVTRCIDCKHSMKVDGMIGLVWCDHLAEVGAWVENDFYCADGERKDGESCLHNENTCADGERRTDEQQT